MRASANRAGAGAKGGGCWALRQRGAALGLGHSGWERPRASGTPTRQVRQSRQADTNDLSRDSGGILGAILCVGNVSRTQRMPTISRHFAENMGVFGRKGGFSSIMPMKPMPTMPMRIMFARPFQFGPWGFPAFPGPDGFSDRESHPLVPLTLSSARRCVSQVSSATCRGGSAIQPVPLLEPP
jgi:hypothetical protein